MKAASIFFFAFSLSLQAAVEFIPKFDDKPVAAEHMEKIEAALPEGPIVEPEAQRRILVVSATAGFRHKSIPTGKFALEKMGTGTGAYETVISDDPANFEPEALETFDTVVLLNTTQDFFMPNGKKKKDYSEEDWKWLQKRQDRLIDNLIDFVEQGGGLVGIHAATDSCYNHEAYGKTIGGYFWGHPWNAGNNVMIVVEDPEHAVNKPVFGETKSFQIKEEIYQFRPEPYSRERLRILLHLDPERSDKVKGMKREDNDYPVAWVQKVGKGRVFYSSLGHNHHIYWDPVLLKHYLAGIQFACGDLEADTTPSAKIQMPSLPACCSGH
ncbi:MAG TPA: ThuA domain-containing protein [Opitutales bacterium]|nr:ThuA domain-containing protein [Opitutales bacterium]